MAGPILWRVRRDLRLADNPALAAAVAGGGAVVPVFVLDPAAEALGAAAKWRLGQGLAAFDAGLRARGSRLILRRGEAGAVLAALAAETGAQGVVWNRLYDPASRTDDTALKARLRAAGLAATSHAGHLLHEPWTIATAQGGPYRVFTPFWRALRARDPGLPWPAPDRLPAPAAWPASDALEGWRLGAGVGPGGAVLARHAVVGEAAAASRLARFLGGVAGYGAARDLPAAAATSGLSENLTWGEIGVRTLWAAAEGLPGAEAFLRQLAWREFAWHLMFHAPDLGTANWRPGWDGFGWQGDGPTAERWRRGMTGEPFVDAGLRQMFVTGTMHNRVRMIAASYLTKHLLTDWRVGLAWFADCLTDWDEAANALGWQWVAGPGPDAAPFFRIFNPATQAARFDPDSAYRRRFVAELAPRPGPEALAFFEAAPRAWGLDPRAPYPAAMVDLAAGRARALAAWKAAMG